MVAVKANKQYTITEAEKKSYLAQGYDIIGDNGAQLKQLGQIDLLEKAMSLIPQVRMDAGLPPLVTPTSQIIGAQAVSCALDELKGRPMHSGQR